MIQFQCFFIVILLFASSIGCIQHMIDSFKHRDKAGMLEGLIVLLLFIAAAYGMIYFTFFREGH